VGLHVVYAPRLQGFSSLLHAPSNPYLAESIRSIGIVLVVYLSYLNVRFRLGAEVFAIMRLMSAYDVKSSRS